MYLTVYGPTASAADNRRGRSASACCGNLDSGITVYLDDSSRALLDDEHHAFNRESCRPFDGKGIGSVDDPKRLRFSVTTLAEGQVVLGLEQPGIACPRREEGQVPNGHDTRVPDLCELRDVTNFAVDIGFDEAPIDQRAPLAQPLFPLQSPFVLVSLFL